LPHFEEVQVPLPLSKALALRANGIPRTPKELEQSFRLLGVLRPIGFQQSVRAGMSLDGAGNPVPWWTFAANEWVKARLRPTDRVFEYGSGGSTLWLAAHAKSVVSVEHDRAWFEKLRPHLPANATVMHKPADDEFSTDVTAPYCAAIMDHEPPFDVVVIDGMERNACARLAARAVSANGIIIFDNSHRARYSDGMKSLAQAGFWRIDLAGCIADRGLTSIFGRSTERWLDASLAPEDYGT
jgi:hypothetical protein